MNEEELSFNKMNDEKPPFNFGADVFKLTVERDTTVHLKEYRLLANQKFNYEN